VNRGKRHRTGRPGRKAARIGLRNNSESIQIRLFHDRDCGRFDERGQCQRLRHHEGECEFA
jgi:hypothetical protein